MANINFVRQYHLNFVVLNTFFANSRLLVSGTKPRCFMKTRSVLLSLFCLITFAVAAQGVENDDMYFNSKDRAKLKAQEDKQLTYASAGNSYSANPDASN